MRGDGVPIVLEEIEELGTPRVRTPTSGQPEMTQVSDSGKSGKMEQMRARLEWAERGNRNEEVKGDENV